MVDMDLSLLFWGFWIGVVLFILSIFYVSYRIVDHFFFKHTIESSIRITPDYRLKGEGKNIDTIYIYKFSR